MARATEEPVRTVAREVESADAESAGLCATCRHAGRQENKRGGTFWRCLRADRDPRFRRYPPLPVRTCPGHEEDPPR